MSDEDFINLCRSGSAEEVSKAIQDGANVNAKSDNGRTVLMEAAIWNEKNEVFTTLVDAGADINAKDDMGWTVLIAAAGRKSPEIVTMLINAGVDVNVSDNSGVTALMHASTPEVFRALVKAGADINIKDAAGHTALDLARASGNWAGSDALKLLEKKTKKR